MAKKGETKNVQVPDRRPDDGYLASEPSNIDARRVWLSGDSFIAAARFIRDADGKPPPKY
jgi:hypothetical protein